MPSKVVFDTLSTKENLPGSVLFETGLDLSNVTEYLQLPSGSAVDIPETMTVPNGAMRWSTDKVAVEYYTQGTWKAISVEEDWDNYIRSGLLAYFDVEDFDSFSGAGNTWINLSKFFTVGTAIPQDDIAFDNVNRGFAFNGSTKYFQINKALTTDAYPDDVTGSTYSFWFKTGSASTGTLFSMNDVNPNPILQIAVNPSGGIYYNDNLVTGATVGSTQYNDNQWYNLCITIPYGGGGQTATFYINGSSIGTLSGVSPTYSSTEYIAVGSNYSSGITPISPTEVFNGYISFFSVHERALTSAEVTSNFDALKYRYGY